MRLKTRSTTAVRAWGALLVLLLALGPVSAQACMLNNSASLYADGVQASPTASNASGSGPWAPFSIGKAFATTDAVRLSEARSDLARSLTTATLAAPFRWVFGDGTTALGHVATHRYARPGVYHLMVYGLDTPTQHWFEFDSALLRIVPPDQVIQSNLGYYALRAVDVVMSSLMWLFDGVCALILVAVIVSAARKRLATGHGRAGAGNVDAFHPADSG